MTHCRGIPDWLSCINCEHICSQHCPLEAEDVIGTLSDQLKRAGFKDLEMRNQTGGFNYGDHIGRA